MCVSVITPVFNESKNIEKCYKSLCSQEGIIFEWVVVDDGSTDDTVNVIDKIISAHDDKKFNIIFLKQENGGAAAARYNGILHCNFDVIVILDADDQLSNNALRFAFSKISSDVDFVCFDVHHVDCSGQLISKFQYSPTSWPVNGLTAFSQCIDGWGLTGCSMLKKQLMLDAYRYIEHKLNGNYVNIDELVSRLCMYWSRKVDHCDGVYFYYKNPHSTTNGINKNYYKTGYVAIELHSFVQSGCNDDLQKLSQLHLLSTLFGIYSRYRKWYRVLDNSNEWVATMKKISSKVNIHQLLSLDMAYKEKLKVYVKLLLAFKMCPSLILPWLSKHEY